LDIPTICQRLFYRDEELLDGTATLGSLGVVANSRFDMRQLKTKNDFDSDDNVPISKRREAEGKGFGGTVLLGRSSSHASSPTNSRGATPLQATEKSCPTCTLTNPIAAFACEVCETCF
jgi:ubiquitin carboxyl-terminal hydrolase 48